MSENYKVYKNREVKKALEDKGFISRTKKHHFMIFIHNGKKTRAHTIIRLKPNQNIPRGLFSKISNDLFLDNSELIDLIECPLTQNDYSHLLIERTDISER